MDSVVLTGQDMDCRVQIRAHAQSLQCPFVIGYTESCTIHDDVCVISAT